MLHIIWMILKVLGILLLVLLGILLFLVLSILFVPVTYRMDGKKDAQVLEGTAVVKWLLGLLYCKVQYRTKKPVVTVRIFGISLKTIKKLLSSKKQRKAKMADYESEQMTETILKQEEPVSVTTKPEGDAAEAPIRPEPDAAGEKEQKGSQFFYRISSFFRRLAGIPSRIKGFFHKIKLTWKNICGTIKKCRSFVQDADIKEVISLLKTSAGKLLRHLMPRTVKGHLKFGFEDPALTGEVLGIASFLPIHKTKLNLIPVFEQSILEGEVRMRGRIVGCVLAITAWRVYRCQAVKRVTNKYYHKEA